VDDFPDSDLVLTTAGEGPVSVSRTFRVLPGSFNARLRYRFVTWEYPTYYGTRFDDTFSVVVRSASGGVLASKAGSLNSLPPSAYTVTGEVGPRAPARARPPSSAASCRGPARLRAAATGSNVRSV
jgi:hypothetical protein